MPGRCRHLPFLSKGADIRKLACKELVTGTCRHLPLLSKGADIRKLACKELVTGTCSGLGWVGWLVWLGLAWLGLVWLGFVVGSSTLALTATIFIYSRA